MAALAPLVAVTRYRNHLELERQRAEAANAAKSDFLAMMSHELRTPLTAILGISDLLLSERLSADLTNKISWISKSGRLLLGLLNDALDFSKIEANHLAIEQSVFRPRELFRNIQNLFTPLAAEKKLILHVDFADNVEDRLISDASRLRQVIVNLVGNAVKFTEHGRVDVRVAQEYQNGNQRMLTAQVIDTGIGLGLAISRRIVELMGGHITVTSEEHQGTTFTFSVPVLEDMEEPALSFLSKPSHPPQNPPQGLRILVAEDDETIAFLLQTMLVRWGNTVDVVGDGGAAVTAAQSQVYDIVLMDMQMHNVDGASATRAITQLDGKTGGIPVIALTADVSARNQEDLLSSGVSALLSKPINWVELSAEIERHVPAASPPNKRNAAQPAALSQNNTAVLDEVVLARLKQDIGGENFPAMLDKFADGLDQYAEDFSNALRDSDITKLKRLAHSFRRVSQQFGAIHAAGLAISISAASTAAEAQPLVIRLLEGFAGLKKVHPGIPHLHRAARSPCCERAAAASDIVPT